MQEYIRIIKRKVIYAEYITKHKSTVKIVIIILF